MLSEKIKKNFARLKKGLDNPEKPRLEFFNPKKVFLAYTNDFAGRADLYRDIIYIEERTANDFNELLSTFFHEYAHIHMKYHNIYSQYIRPFTVTRYTRKDHRNLIKVYVKAEQSADHIAAELMDRYFPDFEFIPCYVGRTLQDCKKEVIQLLNDPEEFELSYQEMKEFAAALKKRKSAIYT